MNDEIIKALRATKENFAKDAGFDINRLVESIQREEAASVAQGRVVLQPQLGTLLIWGFNKFGSRLQPEDYFAAVKVHLPGEMPLFAWTRLRRARTISMELQTARVTTGRYLTVLPALQCCQGFSQNLASGIGH